ncbi:hypothetical protein GCM10017600_76010 [Streptosporangium carneum]|uniref:PASTA domain-containing protein n=2 Tax=Streptosporangium carneum TaxID=47481 RepID=A0A9W6IAM1_9ACTN|nr:hypothetical protein GCM10017600_76010 [Streptosporangium carneum]
MGCLVAFLGLAIVGGCVSLFTPSEEGNGSSSASAAPFGTEKIKVPALKGKQVTAAQEMVQKLNLRFTQTGITPGSFCAPGQSCLVYAMKPAPGTEVGWAAEVSVTFVTGPQWSFYKKNRTMPNVIGWSDEKMGSLFEPVSGLVTASFKQSAKTPVGQNTVIAQAPKPGAPLKVGQKIKLVVGVNYGNSTSTGNGDADVDVDVDVRRSGEGRFCSKRWWC